MHDVSVLETRTKEAALLKKNRLCLESWISNEFDMLLEDNNMEFQIQVDTKAFAKCNKSLNSEFLQTSAQRSAHFPHWIAKTLSTVRMGPTSVNVIKTLPHKHAQMYFS